MSFRYVNFYANEECGGVYFLDPLEAQRAAFFWGDHKLVKQTLDGRWHRPPVGMSADKASHFWVMSGCGFRLKRAAP